ncbi:hypothetical protein BGAL_0002g00930 [Botrytis galanthina]|uniref:Major facilitator superfamily (MFS) profile domain-containing protein n=1 Tax=Botrytis galanthina TaxID=278940 RepID=A0A4S8RCK8_9HELO|nr:hypothetical protein BGAL_0002g00930 [Botrytis galanthina]
MDALIVGRAICGLGGAIMYSGVMVLLSVITLKYERPIYFGLCGTTWGTGTILGPIQGVILGDGRVEFVAGTMNHIDTVTPGFLHKPYGWWYLRITPSEPPRDPTDSSIIGCFENIDLIVTLLVCGYSAAGIMAVSFGGIVYTWNSVRIIGLSVIAGVLLFLFAIQKT